MSKCTTTITVELDDETLSAVDAAIAAGAAASRAEFLERALKRGLLYLEESPGSLEWEDAARDPIFLQDIAELHGDYARSDGESARSIP